MPRRPKDSPPPAPPADQRWSGAAGTQAGRRPRPEGPASTAGPRRCHPWGAEARGPRRLSTSAAALTPLAPTSRPPGSHRPAVTIAPTTDRRIAPTR